MSSKEYYQKYREKNREVLRARAQQWYQNNKKKARGQQRKRAFGVDPDEFENMVERQRNRCLITQKEFVETPHIDHDHKSGKIRGLLSRNANMALGLLQEDPETFYRAVAYLTLDRTKQMIYVIGSLRNKKILDVATGLRKLGYDAFDNWMSAGPTADDSWQEYARQRGMSYTEALESREANHVFRFDKAYLDLCDAAVLVMPAGKSGHLELGYIAGKGNPCFILLEDEPDRYDVMPQFATRVFNNEEEMYEYFR